MTNRSNKGQGGRNQSPSDQSSASNRTDQGNEAQSCPTPGERRDSEISNDSEEEE